jgi:predicted protein tyrosine phosphatase
VTNAFFQVLFSLVLINNPAIRNSDSAKLSQIAELTSWRQLEVQYTEIVFVLFRVHQKLRNRLRKSTPAFLIIHKNSLNLFNNPPYILVDKCLIMESTLQTTRTYKTRGHAMGTLLIITAILFCFVCCLSEQRAKRKNTTWVNFDDSNELQSAEAYINPHP